MTASERQGRVQIRSVLCTGTKDQIRREIRPYPAERKVRPTLVTEFTKGRNGSIMKKRCVIVGGADIGCIGLLREQLTAEDYVVFCDSGLKHLEALGVQPDLIVGDFDSHPDPRLAAETIVLPCEKDDTDTMFAVREGIRRGFDDFLLIGVVGARLDHTLGNVSILLYLDSLGKKACIIDDYSDMEIVSASPVSVSGRYAFFSLLNISGCARGVTVTGAKYPLEDAEITCEYPYGISNEVLPGGEAAVSVREGRLLLIKDRPVPEHR